MSLFLCSGGDALLQTLRSQPEPITWLELDPAPLAVPVPDREVRRVLWKGESFAALDGSLVVAVDLATLTEASNAALREEIAWWLAQARSVLVIAGELAPAGASSSAMPSVPETMIIRAPVPDNLSPDLLQTYGVRRLLVLCGSVCAEYDPTRSLLTARGAGSIFAATLPTTAQLSTVPLIVHVLANDTSLPW